ncbi:sigma-70 family RNA polymerase sigma factor [Fulvivirgaceae bacterium BMA12]|uniref:Sigma-70 family RNA polymerase sigma factor n=1 Tax=Agaribacillus aureus TaxID=3051825 RepID=A0ABT8L0V8_9BACT|nr:sigma-70 family RNA polymerase sigma factor [Fulvivirgaceae bacterium BMA12]
MQVSGKLTNEDLILAIKSGTNIDEAISFIYKNYYSLLENIVLSNNGNKADAEDIIQEVLVIFIEMVNKDKYRAEASVKSFLYTLTRNLWISELRKKSSAQKRNTSYEDSRELIERDISDYLVYHESRKLVMTLFEKLGEKCNKILTYFYYDNFSMKEILQKVDYESEQVLRNKKYKCLKGLINMVNSSPGIKENLKTALQNGK